MSRNGQQMMLRASDRRRRRKANDEFLRPSFKSLAQRGFQETDVGKI